MQTEIKEEIFERLKNMDINDMTPMKALKFLFSIKSDMEVITRRKRRFT